jgi:hypothetical protein
MEDRKMIHRRIKFVMIPHSGMFVICSLLHGEHCFDDAELHFSVLHFSVCISFAETFRRQKNK